MKTPGEVFAVANMKGGVGKTATVIALCQTIAALYPKERILVIDADAQASASFCLAGDEIHTELIQTGKTVDAFLEDSLLKNKPRDLTSCVRSHVASVSHKGAALDISLIASSPVLRGIERGLIHALTRSGFDMERIEREMCDLMREELKPLKSQFKFIIFDCAPGISLLTEAAIRVADRVIVPTIPDYLSVLGLNAFMDNVWNQLADGLNGLPRPAEVPLVLITRKRNINAHNRTLEKLRELSSKPGIGFKLLKTIIREHPNVPNAIERTATDYPLYLNLWGDLVPDLTALATELTSTTETDAIA